MLKITKENIDAHFNELPKTASINAITSQGDYIECNYRATIRALINREWIDWIYIINN